MATLSNETLHIGDCVYDIMYGPGEVVAVEGSGRFVVSFGSAGRSRKYTSAGMTGKNCYRTLYHKPPAIIEFPRDECNAAKLSCALTQVMEIFNDLTSCSNPAPESCCEEPKGCNQWQ